MDVLSIKPQAGIKVIGGVLLSLLLLMTPVRADEADVPVTLKTNLDGASTKTGDLFEAVLTQDVVVDATTIPSGTVLKGYVEKVRESKRLGRPGYVAVTLDEAVFPTGERYAFPKDAVHQRIYSAQSQTGKRKLLTRLPMGAVSAGVSVPLRVATSLGSGVITPISLGARMITGVIMEMANRDPADTRTTGQKVYRGVAEGTGIPTGLYFLGKQPEPVYLSGQTLTLHLKSKDLEPLSKALTLPQNAPDLQTPVPEQQAATE